MTKQKYELVLIALAMLVFAAMLAVSAFQFTPLEAQFVRGTVTPQDGTILQTAENGSIQLERQNLNRSTWQELAELPGIGQVKAQAIVRYREENGLFRSVDELLLVPGIGQKLFLQIQNLVTV